MYCSRYISGDVEAETVFILVVRPFAKMLYQSVCKNSALNAKTAEQYIVWFK